MVLNAKATMDKHMEGGLYKVVPNFLLSDEYPELVLIPTVHNVEITEDTMHSLCSSQFV